MPISPTDELGTHVAQVLSANYELETEVGRGGMGIVYCARDRRLKREIAIKVLPPELSFRADIRQRFLREAETAAQLNHPNIVPIYTVEAICTRSASSVIRCCADRRRSSPATLLRCW